MANPSARKGTSSSEKATGPTATPTAHVLPSQMTTTADKSVLVSPSERARIARQEPSLANRILLLEFAEAPADLPGALVAKGYFKLYCTYRPLTWDSLASKTFQPAFKNGIVDIRGQNLRGQDLDSNLVYRFVGAAKHPFVTALHEFFYTKFRNFFKYDPAGLLPAMEVHVFKFAPKMCFRSHFFDSLKPMENGVPAYRIIWFSHHVKVIFSKFAGADFLSQQKTLFDSIITCENDVHVFGFAAYGQKCGKAGVVDLQANEVLLLPAPCVFKVETGLPQIIMCTSLLLSKGNKASGKGVGGLQLCTTAGAVKSSAPFGAKPLFASFTPNQQRKSSFGLSPRKQSNSTILGVMVTKKPVLLVPGEKPLWLCAKCYLMHKEILQFVTTRIKIPLWPEMKAIRWHLKLDWASLRTRSLRKTKNLIEKWKLKALNPRLPPQCIPKNRLRMVTMR